MTHPYRVDPHPGLEADFADIFDLLSPLIGPAMAKARIDEILDDLALLANVPKKGSLRPGSLRAIPVGRNAVATFRVDDATRSVLVLSVTWGGADWSRRTRQR